MIAMPALPNHLPWHLKAYLVLDAVRLPDLAERLQHWANPKEYLYVTTRWHALVDISPCLISLSGPDDPVLRYFKANAEIEPGYLLFTQTDAATLCTFLRSLIVVQHPSGDEVMMRMADPAVLHQLISASENPLDSRWLGPSEQICLPDGLHVQWLEHKRPASAGATVPSTLRLSDQELTALGEVEFRRFVLRLTRHMTTYFPDVMAQFSETERRIRAYKLAQMAYSQGFYSAREVTLYANVLCLLVNEGVDSYPDIHHLLNQPSTTQTPLERVTLAAELAQAYRLAAQGQPQ